MPDTALQGTYENQQLGRGLKITGKYNDKGEQPLLKNVAIREKIKALVEDAIAATANNDYDARPTIDLNNSNNLMTLDDEREYWVSEQFTVSTDGNTNGKYNVTLINAHEGTKILNTSGNETSNFNILDYFII